MSTSRNRETTRLPALMTVEEAAAALRIGRTKAYAMAREWRETGGRSGLPVVDLGNVLRVPLCQLEVLIGASFTNGDLETASPQLAKEPAPASDPAPSPQLQQQPQPQSVRAPRPSRRRARHDQLDLFDPDLTAS